MPQRDIALIGLAVMGQNLARNMDRNGYQVTVYNRSEEKTREFMAVRPRRAPLRRPTACRIWWPA